MEKTSRRMAVTVSAEGLQVCEAADISPDLADYREAKEECPLDGVCTLQEACGLYGMSEQQVEDICGRGMEENSAGGPYPPVRYVGACQEEFVG